MAQFKASIFAEYKGEVKTVTDLAKEVGVKRATIYKRIYRKGVSFALSPRKKKRDIPSESFRPPTDTEIEGAKMLRSLKSHLPNIQHFFNNVYFDIQDNGITEKTAEKIRRNLMLNRHKMVGVDAILEKMNVVPEVKRFARKREITWLDIHVAICNSDRERKNGKKVFTTKDMEELLSIVAEEFGVSTEDIKGKSKKQIYFKPRMVFSYICYSKLSFAKIGAFLGGRGHSTILSAVAAMEYEMKKDADLLLKYNNIKNMIDL